MFTRSGGLFLVLIVGGSLSFAPAQEKVVGPVRVKIQDEKPAFFEVLTPIDPVKRVEYQSQPNSMYVRITAENQSLHLGFIYQNFKIDQNVTNPMGGAVAPNPFGGPPIPNGGVMQWEIQRANLPKTPSGKVRDGFMCVGKVNGIRITQTVEVVPCKSEGKNPRRLDAVLVRFTLENKDTVPHQVGVRTFMDVYVVNNDGALFAAPNQPGQILDGVELKDKMMPDYLQLLQVPNLQNPGFVGHLTFNLGSSVEGPSRVVMTNLGACFNNNNWDIAAIPANGDSAVGFFWEPREIKPGAKREVAYALGKGVASKLDNEGAIKLDLVGSFEPNKMFTINAFVSDPAPGQSLTLELPDGMERLEGKETQPVPALDAEGNCLIQWKARVLRPGQYNLRVHSTLGVTQTKIITVTKEQ